MNEQLSWFESQKDKIKSKAFPILAANWIVKQGGICCDLNGGPVPLVEVMKPQIEAYHKLNKIMYIICPEKEKQQPSKDRKNKICENTRGGR